MSQIKDINRNRERTSMRGIVLVSTACLLMAICGCRGENVGYSGPIGTLSGKVTIDGKAPPDGSVMVCIHAESGFGTSARLKPDGSYSLQGVRVGKYHVGFSGPSAADTENMDPDVIMEQQQAGTLKTVENPIPANLASPEESGLTIEVKEGESQFDLAI